MTTTTNTFCPPKPRIRLVRPDTFDIDFGNGETVQIGKADDGEWRYHMPGECGRHTYGPQEAFAQAWMASIEPPPPVGIEREKLQAMITEAECCATKCAKLMKTLLKLRTGIAWSVTGGRGTGRSWLNIMSPKARRVDSDGRPSTKSWGYMSARDRAILGSVLGNTPHNQGESIRTEGGVRESYLWKIAGLDAPADLRVQERGWD